MSKRGPKPPDISGEALLDKHRKPGPASPGFKWKASLLLAALAALVYLNTLQNDLVYDDALIVEQHQVIRDPSNFPDIWTKAGWLPNRTGIVYRPLSLSVRAFRLFWTPNKLPLAMRANSSFLAEKVCNCTSRRQR